MSSISSSRKSSRRWSLAWFKIRKCALPKQLTPDNTLYVSKSKSILKHVEIVGAGKGKWKGKSNATSAIETWGCPPIMEHILIENSAYNGTVYSDPLNKALTTKNHLKTH